MDSRLLVQQFETARNSKKSKDSRGSGAYWVGIFVISLTAAIVYIADISPGQLLVDRDQARSLSGVVQGVASAVRRAMD